MKKRLTAQIDLLEHLRKKKFPYEVILPIKNKDKEYVMKVKGRRLWVYHYIEGEQKKVLTKKNFQEIAKTLAIFHKYSKSFKRKENGFEKTLKWVEGSYRKLSKRKIKTKQDKLFAENREFFANLLKKIKKIDFGKQQTTHRDFHEGNLIFRNGKVKGIIDFDASKNSPKVLDIALALYNSNYLKHGWTKEKQKIFLKAYEKIAPLTKKEKSFIPALLIRHHALLFVWFYDEMEKNQDKVLWSMNNSIKETKMMLEEAKNNGFKGL